MTLVLTIAIQDSNDPRAIKTHVVECDDLMDAFHELLHVAGPAFRKEMMWGAWHRLNEPPPREESS